MKKLSLFVFLTLLTISLKAQVVWEHVNTVRIYMFIDELVSEHIITINSAIKPYSRHFIALKLLETIIWQKEEAGLMINYEPFNNIQIHAAYTWCYIKTREADGQTADYYLNQFGPAFYNGKNHLIKAGLNFGF